MDQLIKSKLGDATIIAYEAFLDAYACAIRLYGPSHIVTSMLFTQCETIIAMRNSLSNEPDMYDAIYPSTKHRRALEEWYRHKPYKKEDSDD
jgi:hypothetical protein